MEKRWVLKEGVSPEKSKKLEEALNISPFLARMLLRRGIEDFNQAKDFFRPSIDHLHNPLLMKDMEPALDRLDKAIESKEKILIYGDYDVDGTTAVALVFSFLSGITSEIEYYIPDRYKEGYGISFDGIDYAAENNFRLIIALDCGIKSVDKVLYAKEKGVDFIICDHHLPGDQLPEAVAVLDPKRTDCSYPYKELSGCGIGFKLLQGYTERHHLPFESLLAFIDLTAVSIAADIVPITGENRVLAYYGLKKINENPLTGLKAMLILSVRSGPFDISPLVFIIAPRINAAGRIESGKSAVQLLITKNLDEAIEHGKKLDDHNAERKTLDKEITDHALNMIREDSSLRSAKTTVLWHEDWHKGVVGIVASRLIETYYRPTILLTHSDGKLTGSARSVKDYDVYEAIEACSEFLIQFGGHKYAAGLTMKPEQFDAFQKAFEEYVKQTISDDLLIPSVEIEEILPFQELIPDNGESFPKFFRILRQFEPFGPLNDNPIFQTDKVMDTGYAKIVGENHLKFTVCQKGDKYRRINAIGFGLGEHLQRMQSGEEFSVAYQLSENEWQGKRSLQLMVKDIRWAD